VPGLIYDVGTVHMYVTRFTLPTEHMQLVSFRYFLVDTLYDNSFQIDPMSTEKRLVSE